MKWFWFAAAMLGAYLISVDQTFIGVFLVSFSVLRAAA